MNLKKYDQREKDLKEAKDFCDELRKLLTETILEGGQCTFQTHPTMDDIFRAPGKEIIIRIKGAYHHQTDVRYSQ